MASAAKPRISQSTLDALARINDAAIPKAALDRIARTVRRELAVNCGAVTAVWSSLGW